MIGWYSISLMYYYWYLPFLSNKTYISITSWLSWWSPSWTFCEIVKTQLDIHRDNNRTRTEDTNEQSDASFDCCHGTDISGWSSYRHDAFHFDAIVQWPWLRRQSPSRWASSILGPVVIDTIWHRDGRVRMKWYRLGRWCEPTQDPSILRRCICDQPSWRRQSPIGWLQAHEVPRGCFVRLDNWTSLEDWCVSLLSLWLDVSQWLKRGFPWLKRVKETVGISRTVTEEMRQKKGWDYETWQV